MTKRVKEVVFVFPIKSLPLSDRPARWPKASLARCAAKCDSSPSSPTSKDVPVTPGQVPKLSCKAATVVLEGVLLQCSGCPLVQGLCLSLFLFSGFPPKAYKHANSGDIYLDAYFCQEPTSICIHQGVKN